MSTTYALIACDVFEEELAALGGENPPWQRIDYLEMGLHDRPDDLRRQIQARIARIEEDAQIDTILLAYGLCGNGLLGIRAGRCPLILPRADDCISILLGGPEPHNKVLQANPGTYFYSPGWVRAKRVPGPDRADYVRELYADRYPDDPEMVEELIEMDAETFTHHNCAAYVDLTENQKAENYCQDCARHLDWEFKRLKGDPVLLRDLLQGDWDESRYLTVPPGAEIRMGTNSQLTIKVIK